MITRKGILYTALVGLVGTVAGCAVTYDVIKVGPDTYQTSAIASPVRGGIAGAQRMAIANANKKCDSMGKTITVTNSDTRQENSARTAVAPGTSIVTFTCT